MAKRKTEIRYVYQGNDDDLSDLLVITEDALNRRFKRLYDLLWDGGTLSPFASFRELGKLLFCKIADERREREPYEPYDFQVLQIVDDEGVVDLEKTNESLYERISALYDEGRLQSAELFVEDIHLDAKKLRLVVEQLQDISLSKTDIDSKGRAFEIFTSTVFRSKFGQYFTPRSIVKFIVDVLPIKHNSLVLDASSGSGGFLLHTLEKVKDQGKGWTEFSQERLFGIEIDEQVARTAKLNMLMYGANPSNIISVDGLLPVNDVYKDGNIIQEGVFSRTGNSNFQYNHFDFVITNPPFGSTIKRSEKPYLQTYQLAQKEGDWLKGTKSKARKSQSTETLFMEQYHRYLKEGGYLAMVIPDGMLTNSSLQYVRDKMAMFFRIVAVISLPQTTFKPTGAGVKSSIVFLRKHSADYTESMEQQLHLLQNRLKQEFDYDAKLQRIEKERSGVLKRMDGFDNTTDLVGDDLKKSSMYKAWRSDVSSRYKKHIDELRQEVQEMYLEKARSVLQDYPIFMAIVEDVGYDSTGKPTHNNELPYFGERLEEFISSLSDEVFAI